MICDDVHLTNISFRIIDITSRIRFAKIATSWMKIFAIIHRAGVIINIWQEEVASNIDTLKNSNKVLIYTYGLSPFSSEALSILDNSGYEYTNIELGKEWFLLDGAGSETRVALSKLVNGGATSLPKVFIGGECIGGCAELANIVESGELDGMMKKAKVGNVKNGGGDKPNFFTNLFA